MGSMEHKRMVAGKSACPEGKVHRWPERSSNGSHTFGAAAVRRIEGSNEDVAVTFYADVYGKRTGELEYTGEEWDGAMQRLAEAKDNRAEAYDVLDRLTTAFGHAALRTLVTIDLSAPPESQVRMTQEGSDGQRIVTDSIASAEAFIKEAQGGGFSSSELLKATVWVSEAEYYGLPTPES